jgi:hypothetical protein
VSRCIRFTCKPRTPTSTWPVASSSCTSPVTPVRSAVGCTLAWLHNCLLRRACRSKR